MQEAQVRGIYVVAACDFIKANYPPAQVARIERQLSPELKHALPSIREKRMSWYPVRFATEQLRGIYHSHDDRDVAAATLTRCGRFIGDEATTTFLRLLFKMMTLPMLATKWQQFWNKYHDFGLCEADASRIEEKLFIVDIRTYYPFLRSVGAGWIHNVIAGVGKKNVRVASNVPEEEMDVTGIIYTATWD